MGKALQTITKWMRFNAIGTVGLGVQLVLWTVLTRIAGMNYLLATYFAVQTALIHNFFWHQRWTWRENISGGRFASMRRFLRFNSSSGAISILGNVGFTWIFARAFPLPYIFCNLMAIGICNIANFLVLHRFVFQPVAVKADTYA